MGDGLAPQVPPSGNGPSGRPLPLSVRLLGAGVRGARTVTRAAGIDRAVEAAAEEAMVAPAHAAADGPETAKAPASRGLRPRQVAGPPLRG